MNLSSTKQPRTFWQDKSASSSFDSWDVVGIVVPTVLSNIVCLLGIVTNIVNLLVIIRQGFADSVNISLLGLTISDMGGLVTLLWLNLCKSPLIIKLVDPPYLPGDFCFLPPGVLRVAFSRMTCYVTIFITVQRCLCISYPLKVKFMMTPSNTTLIMLSMSLVVFFLHCFAISCTGVVHIGWKPVPLENTSFIGLVTSDNFQVVYNISIFIATFFQLASFLAIILFTAILVYQLRQNTKWRDSAMASGQNKTKSYSFRSHKLGPMIVLLSGILIACYTPSTLALILSLCLPTVSNVESPEEQFNFFWTLGFLCEAVKSSVNICVYYRMSSRFRITLSLVFSTTTNNTKSPQNRLQLRKRRVSNNKQRLGDRSSSRGTASTSDASRLGSNHSVVTLDFQNIGFSQITTRG